MFLFAAFFAATVAADAGMWLLPYLQKMNIADMRAKGCELSAEEIYAADRSSLKDAIVIFGAGCTGEVVSPDGLLLTNHHCGYGEMCIRDSSSPRPALSTATAMALFKPP